MEYSAHKYKEYSQPIRKQYQILKNKNVSKEKRLADGYSEILKNVTFDENHHEEEDPGSVTKQLLASGYTIGELMNQALSGLKPINPKIVRRDLTIDEKIDRVIKNRQHPLMDKLRNLASMTQKNSPD